MILLLSLLLTACGRGVSPTTTSEPEEAATISVFGSDGPVAGADVFVYDFVVRNTCFVVIRAVLVKFVAYVHFFLFLFNQLICLYFNLDRSF